MVHRSWVEQSVSALFTDLYELTMSQAFEEEGMRDVAVFELFFRNLPPTRNYLIAAGIQNLLEAIENLTFESDDLEYLRGLGLFSEPFLDRLRRFRFSGDVWAIPEGSVVFANEPIVQIAAPILEAQVIETLVLNQVQFASLAAAKAARVVTAAAGRDVVEFGSRRAHGESAALTVARASYLVGAVGTSNVLAGQRFGIPVYGTMAHSYIQAHDDEASAFRAFAARYPETTLLIDTYDVLAAVREVIALTERLGDRFRVAAIRLDSGDLADLARKSRRMLDDSGMTHVRIFASGGLDEFSVESLVASGAPIDAFGVGTKLAVSDDAPSVDMVYKLVDYAGRPRMKRSSGKATYPGRKQVFRWQRDGAMVGDVVGRYDEQLDGRPLLEPVVRGGIRLAAGRTSLDEARAHAQHSLAELPRDLRSLTPADIPYSVNVSQNLEADRDALLRCLTRA
jgi:nicotinate phosphoribosyltransferase